MPLNGLVLLVSGRVSLEIVQKAAVAGIPIVCAVSAPSDLAVEAAERFGQTLIGFLRGDGFNVYTGAERLRLSVAPRCTAGASGGLPAASPAESAASSGPGHGGSDPGFAARSPEPGSRRVSVLGCRSAPMASASDPAGRTRRRA